MLKFSLIFSFILIFLKSLIALNKDTNAINFSKYISVQELKYHISILTSDSLEGRGTGEKGQYLAADYIRNHFKKNGLLGPVNDTGYFQNFYVKKTLNPEITLTINNIKVSNSDFKLFNQYKYLLPKLINVKNILVINKIKDKKKQIKNKALFLNYKNDSIDYLINQYLELIKVSNKSNVKLLLLKRSNIHEYEIMKKLNEKLIEKNIYNNIPILFIDEKYFFDKIFSITLLINPQSDFIKTQNVLSLIKGQTEETIVISSHYDHLGVKEGKIFYGADDNASGTSSLLNIATAFSNAVKYGYKPKRNILFITFSGEEIGLLGSKYYCDSNAVISLNNISTNINIDMVGRSDNIYKNKEKYIYVIGSDKLSSSLHKANEYINTIYQNLILDYKYNDENDPNRFYYRSDHYNFAKYKIPVIFFFNGLHNDYHKPSDTPEKIDYELLEYRTKHFFYLAWYLANMDEKIIIDK